MNEKDHKADFSFITRMLEEDRKAGYEHGYSVGYNEAIDDCIEELKKRRDLVFEPLEQVESMQPIQYMTNKNPLGIDRKTAKVNDTPTVRR